MKDAPSSAPQAEQRRLAAIMFTDIVGFSRQMGSNEAHTLRLNPQFSLVGDEE
jgi:class 3 adenylate cyclase